MSKKFGDTIVLLEDSSAFSWKDPNQTVTIIRAGNIGCVIEVVTVSYFFTFVVCLFTLKNRNPEVFCLVDGDHIKVAK